MQHLRHRDGSYWTGWQYADRRRSRAERSSWTAAAVVLAADALAGFSRGAGVFRDATGPVAAGPQACGSVADLQACTDGTGTGTGASADTGAGPLRGAGASLRRGLR